MEAPSAQQLEALKYGELRRLAKSAGLKANLKADKLLHLLKQHFLATVKENGSMVNKRGLSTDTDELDSSQRLVNESMVTKRRRKQKYDDAQGNPEGKTELPEKEILTEVTECEEAQEVESRKMLKTSQNKCLLNSGTVENLADNSDTEDQQKEKKTRRKGGRILVDPVSEKKPGRKGFASTTPNFKKIHEAQFKKMQSIDEYIERKNKMIRNFSNSVNEVKMLAQKTSQNSSSKKRSSSRGFLLSPYPQRNKQSAVCTPVNLRHSPRNSSGTANKSILSQKSIFSSTCLSTTKMNVRFSTSTKDNEHKRSLTKTPSRKTPFPNVGTPASQESNKSTTMTNSKGSATKHQSAEIPTNSAVTPFKFEATSAKKPVFDLQASLSRPLGYQPHKGKLKPWGKSKENLQSPCSHKRNYKQPLLQTREERRERHVQERKQRKDEVLRSRRGLTVT
ncbi:nucleolar and spindle-associated protein 1 [Podarcis muralis]|uniref:nucleolar and spindle-associated protein 1 isoform X3 n=1 Tax=Podarcis muralis TaxID=64176 RepID=UPI0010A0C085|nr:nucleolar and spindle-associated protein 1 isoform X3 [Podarcis muralis]